MEDSPSLTHCVGSIQCMNLALPSKTDLTVYIEEAAHGSVMAAVWRIAWNLLPSVSDWECGERSTFPGRYTRFYCPLSLTGNVV